MTGVLVVGVGKEEWRGGEREVELRLLHFDAVHFAWNYITYVKLDTNVLHNTLIC